jgi:NADPH-dependent 2,4-dienoyl-CoA reductase/sulfur reductase-like enzyme
MTPLYVIVGTGVAGISAAQTIRQQDSSAKITIIGNDPDLYYSRPGLAYYLTRELPKRSLFPITKGELVRQNIDIHHDYVTKIDAEKRLLYLKRDKFIA